MSFYGVTDLWTYVLGAVGIVLLPGPNSLFVLSVASTRGVKAGYMGACGVFVGDTILLTCTALGAAGLLRTTPILFAVVKYVGAAYLAWVGLTLLRAAWTKWASRVQPSLNATPAPSDLTAQQLAHPFQRALVISVLNPKAILFLLSFFVQFVDPSYPTPALPFLILSCIVMSLSAIYLSVLILAGARLAQSVRQRQRLTASLSGAVGALFLWFGFKLANAGLH